MSSNLPGLTRQQERAYDRWGRLSHASQDRAVRFLTRLTREHAATGQGVHRVALLAYVGGPQDDRAFAIVRQNVGVALQLISTPPAAIAYDSTTNTYRVVEGFDALCQWLVERERSIRGESVLVEQTIATYLESPNPADRARARKLLRDATRQTDAADAIKRRAERYLP